MAEAILITGGAGFIGANFVRQWLAEESAPLVNVDALTYAANPLTLADTENYPRYRFVQHDIADRAAMAQLLAEHTPRAVINFAAESHVDRSIAGPEVFMHSNIQGTFALLEAARPYWDGLRGAAKDGFRFLQVSTDEVFGMLGPDDAAFSETHPMAPNSPYSASKAAADHLVRAWGHTYGLPVLTTRCSNNYGPYQYPEKLIPRMIVQALKGEPLPIFGDGLQVRDWLYVADHCAALRAVLARGTPGETYNIGGGNEWTNRTLVEALCDVLDRLKPAAASYREQMVFVTDRPGHDRRYAIDATKITRELGWKPSVNFSAGLEKTVQWYLDNGRWLGAVPAA